MASPATAMATIVFTDLVDSTGLRAELGEERADQLRRMHDGLLREQVETHGGRIVKGGGDGVLAAFESASRALTATVAMQRAIAAYNRRGDRLAALSIKVGLSAGDVSWEDADCFGTPVVEAARLVAAASGGQILCSDHVRVMARGRGDHHLEPVGDLELKGLPEPVTTFAVQWDDASDPGRPPLPASLAVGLDQPFVGRLDELDRAGAVLDGLRRPEASAVWLVGEPGIGKSALAGRLAADRHSRGWTILFGRCDEALQLPYQPFAQALRDVLTGPEDVGDTLPVPLRRTLARLVPELADGSADPAGVDVDEESDGQARIFDAVLTWMGRTAVAAPTMLVIDDLQWATKTTLLLANYVLRSTGTGRLAVVATVRDTDCPELLQSIIDESSAREGAEVIRLGGLPVDAVAALAGGDRAASLRAKTAGNPFFVRALLAGGEDRSDSVNAAVRRRVGQLGEEEQDVLRTASVAGLEFDVAIVGAALDRSAEDVLAAVETAAGAALVEEVTANRYRFAHEIVRDTLVAELSATRRTLAHRGLADAYERVGSDQLFRTAHHRAGAAVDAPSRRVAVGTLMAAGDAAEAVFDHDEAVRYYAKARALAAESGDAELAQLLRSLGTALLTSGSRSDHAANILDEAIRVALRADLPDIAISAWWRAANLHSSRGTRIPEMPASTMLGSDPVSVAHRRAIELTSAAYDPTLAPEERPTMGDIEDVRSSALRRGDDFAIGITEGSVAMLLPSEMPRERIAALRNAAAHAERVGERITASLHEGMVISSLIALGDLAEARAQTTHLRHEADRRRDRYLQHWASAAGSTLALMSGDLDAAEALAREGADLAEDVEGLERSGQYGVQMFSIRREQGRLHEIAPTVRTLVRLDPDMAGAWRPGLAATYAELGMTDEAATELARLVTDSGVELADDDRMSVSVSYLADAAVLLGDAAHARTMYDLLQRWRDLNVSLELIACYGPTQRYLGMLAFTFGDLDAAHAHLSDALRRCHAMGARTYEAHTHYWLGRVAHRRDQAELAAHHLERAHNLAIAIGMRSLAERARDAIA